MVSTKQVEEILMIELLRQRRSIRRYRDQAIEPETLEILKEAL